MKKKNCLIMAMCVCSILFLILTFGGMSTAQAFEPGKTYDKSNYQEIEDLLIPSVLAWVKSGEFIIKTDKLAFEWVKHDERFIKATQANIGKFDVDSEGQFVHKDTGELVLSYFGYPFPEIDPNDPKAGEYIMENHFAQIGRSYTSKSSARTLMVGIGGLHSEQTLCMDNLMYIQRLEGPIPNPNKFIRQDMIFYLAPYSLRGICAMTWMHAANVENAQFSFLPMLRRVRRTSPASRSDPVGGGDGSSDEANGYGGKNADMSWKLLGEKTFLCMFSDNKEHILKVNPDGSFVRQFFDLKVGGEIPGWQGAAYAPGNMLWMTRPLYMVQMTPKDRYYASGRLVLYVDKECFISKFKDFYTWGGEYYKTTLVSHARQMVPGTWHGYTSDYYLHIDPKRNHGSGSTIVDLNLKGREPYLNLPTTMIGSDYFTMSGMLQKSK